MRKLFLLFFICLCVFPEVLAQHTPSIYGMASKINDFYPVSVEAAALFKKVRKKWTIVEEKSLFVFHYMRLRLHRLLFL